MDDFLRLEDLVNNPTARVPVCLCLDTSGSMARVVGGDIRQTGEQVFEDGRMWNVVTGGVTAIDELNDGVRTFYDELRDDEVAQFSAEICVVSFGGKAELVMDFANLDRQTDFRRLTAKGDTPMGEAVNLALDCLEARKKEYQSKGVDYYQPWLVLMTDGSPDGSSPAELERAVRRTVDLVKNRRLTVFPIGIGPEADMAVLGRFSPARTPLRLRGTKFREFFQWLSQSVSRTSMSMPGENVPLDKDGIMGWKEL